MTLLDVWIDDRLDQTSELFFQYPGDDPKASLLVVDAEVEYDSRKWFVAEKHDVRRGTGIITEIRCEAGWMRLAERITVGSVYIEAQTVADGITQILDPAHTDWTIGPNTATGGASYSYEDQDQSMLSLLRGFAAVTDKVVVFDTENKTVDLVDAEDRQVSKGMAFRYGRNLTSIERRVRPPDVTRLYAFGRDDLGITGQAGGDAFVEDYSFYTAQGLTENEARALYQKDEVWVNTDIVDDVALYAAAQSRLAERAAAILEYKMSVADLSELTSAQESVQLAEQVRVADSELGIDAVTTVVRLKKYPLEPWKNQVELAYLYDPADNAGGKNTRAKSSLTWELFQSRGGLLKLRDNRTWITNRIGAAFAGAAEAVYGTDLVATGVGTGTLYVSAVDAEADVLEVDVAEIPYADGEKVRLVRSWTHDYSDTDSSDELNGQKDYRIRLQAVPTGGGSSTASGVDIAALDARFWILARGATKRTPAAVNSVTYEYTGSAQTFTVPDGVTEITMEVAGSRGAYSGTDYGTGGKVVGKMPVTSGSDLNIVVGGTGTNANSATQTATPSMVGGSGDNVSGANGYAGGGGSGVFPSGSTATTEGYLIAGGAGGNGQVFPAGSSQTGGDGGFFAGQPTADIAGGTGQFPGAPADQYGGGGAGGTGAGVTDPGAAGQTGGSGSGGTAGNATNAFTFPPGGGGGGYNGGGGGGTNNTSGNGNGGGGGGGCGYASAEVYDIVVTDGGNDGSGYVTISWDEP